METRRRRRRRRMKPGRTTKKHKNMLVDETDMNTLANNAGMNVAL